MSQALPSNSFIRSVNILYARQAVQFMLAHYPGLERLLSAEQLDYAVQHELSERCQLSDWHALIRMCAQYAPHQDPIVDLATHFKPWRLGLLGSLLLSSATLGDLLRLMAQMHPLLDDVLTAEHGVQGQLAFFRLGPTSTDQAHCLARITLLQLSQLMRIATDRLDIVAEGLFAGPPPMDATTYHHLLGRSARFDQSDNVLVFDAAHLSAPVVSSDYTVHQLLRNQALQALTRAAPQHVSLEAQLRILIRARLPIGVDHKTLAIALGLSTRALQRRIKEANIPFRSLVEEEKRAAALRCLNDTEMSVLDIALALGFSEHSAFSRSFKRWMGLSPTSYRQLCKSERDVISDQRFHLDGR
jgi:AraC-like DNA-binding protein